MKDLINADLSSKSIKRTTTSYKIFQTKDKFNKNVFKNEMIKLSNLNINEYKQKCQVTHDQYYEYYIETKLMLKDLNISNHKLQVINDNLNSVINTIKNNQDKSISNLNKEFNKIKLVF